MSWLRAAASAALVLLATGARAQDGRYEHATRVPAGSEWAGAVPEGLTAGDWGDIRAAHEAGRHAAVTADGGFRARNPGQRWVTRFDGRGFTTTPDAGGWTWGLELDSYGFPGAERPVEGEAEVRAEGSRVAYAWDATLEEWYVNDRRGLEHGFTVRAQPERPAGADGPLTFTLAVRGGLQPEVSEDGRGARFTDERGATVLTYAGLAVLDAAGESLPACIERADAGLRIVVDERGARYPLTIDPIAQQAYIKASNTEGGDPSPDHFGESVAISGDTVVVGAPQEDSNATGVNGNQGDNSAGGAGAAYVFVRSGSTWTQQAYLKASNTGTGDRFGASVAISGDMVVVGAYGESSNATGVNGNQGDNSAGGAGAAYVFVRSGSTWSQQAYLKASNTQLNDWFGWSVAISGDTVVVAAQTEDSDATGVNGDQSNNLATDSGAVYVFVRSAPATWAQQAYLKASNNLGANDRFGTSVSISDDTLIVGARNEDCQSTGVNGNQFDFGASGAGAAYVFVRDGTTWTQQAYLKASNTGALDFFGWSVSIAGDTAVVGAPEEDGDASDSGAAYVFTRNGTTWSQQAYVKASNTDGVDIFGASVSVSGNTVIVGAYEEDSSATGANGNESDDSAAAAGAAYVFTRVGTTWTQEAYLKASNTDAGDRFGLAVAVSDYTVVVGAPFEDSNATGIDGNEADDSAADVGAVYAIAFTTDWTGATDDDWTDASNWGDGVPNPTLAAIIPDAATTPNDPVISVSGQTCNTLQIETGGTLDVSAGTDSLGVYGGALVDGPVTGTGELVFEAAGTLRGTSTISTALGVRAEYDLALAGSPEITGDLTGNADISVRDGADVDVGLDLVALGDLVLDGALSVDGSLDVDGGLIESVAGESGSGSLFVGGVGGGGECVEVGEVVFSGIVATSCTLRVENSSSSSLVFDLENGWPNSVVIDVAGTITFLTEDLTIGGDLVIESGSVQIDSDTLDIAGANGIVVEAGAELDVTGRQMLVPAGIPILVQGTLSIGPDGEILLEASTVTVESGGMLRLAGDGSGTASLSGFGASRYTLDLEAGSTLAARDFAFRQMSASGIAIGDAVVIAPAPLNLRNGLFDLPADNGVLLDVSRTTPTEFRFLRFENSASASGASNVHVPASSALLTMTFWSGGFAGPFFEDDPGAKLDWGLQFAGSPLISSPALGAPAPELEPLPLVVGPAGGFTDVQSALRSLAGTDASGCITLELAPGEHESFELHGSELAFDLRLVGAPAARIDASLAPLRIVDLPAERSVELVGLVIDGSAAPGPALVVEDATGVVLLERVTVQGGMDGPALRLSAARAVAFQRGAIGGPGGLVLERGSRAVLSAVEVEHIEVTGRSALETCALGIEPRIGPGSTWRDAEWMPALFRRAGDGALVLEAPRGTLALLLASPRLGFALAARPRVDGVFLLDPEGLQLVGIRSVAADGRAEWPIALLSGAGALHVQAWTRRPAGGSFVLSNVARVELR